ncbi:MAG: hypothetical protein RL180_233 [Pseudomonadota bacterium]|jgi:hypothetical protein
MTTPDTSSSVSNARPLLWAGLVGAAAMLLLVVAVLVGYWLGRQDQPNISPATTAASTQATQANPTRSIALQPIITDPVVAEPVITAPLPADTALAGEELDVHTDEQTRLAQQKQSLDQQLSDSEQLIQLKAQQIAALEAQLNAPTAAPPRP